MRASKKGKAESWPMPGQASPTVSGRRDGLRGGLVHARRAEPARQTKFRIALYSHDTMGLGHVRRNLLIAKALASSAIKPTMLMLAGAREAGAFAIPTGVDCVTLPSLCKELCGEYQSRHLDLSLGELIAIRGKILRAALEAFEPDLLIVDNTPRGAVRELDSALTALRRSGCTRCVLGLRDVKDAPEVVRREWLREGNNQAVRDFYDEIWIYGDPKVYDLVKECAFAGEVAAKVHYTGYLDQRKRLNGNAFRGLDPTAARNLGEGRLVLCMVGGGQDGGALARAFVDTALPGDCHGVLLTGPFMPEETKHFLHTRAALNPRMRVLDFVPEPTLFLERADRVITMGGYNSVCEVLSFDKRALIVPRVTPRLEQWIRAQHLQRLGLADMLHPDELCPQALAAWLARDEPRPRVRSRIDLSGLATLPHLAGNLLHGLTDAVPGFSRTADGSPL